MAITYTLIACATLVAIDGDSIRCDGRNMRLLGNGAPFVSGVDAPELDGKCLAEKMLARAAKRRLEQLLQQPGLKVEDSGQLDDTYSRRPLVRVRLPDGRFAGQVLIEEGLAVRWLPKGTVDWCKR